ncbi:hypothetical protein [Natrinema soli]|uniref:hypothetical protein n=1 Tax=Natrinema soli TaxID=1930624 RepID=UPI0023626845|nr:hypothetical protein [Natrinema soli]
MPAPALAGITTVIGCLAVYIRLLKAATTDGILPRWVGRENRNGEPIYVLLVLYAASVATVFLNIPLQVLASGVTLAVVTMFILVTMVGIRLPSQFSEVFERDAVRVNRYLSPRIVRNASAVALAIIEKATAMGIK